MIGIECIGEAAFLEQWAGMRERVVFHRESFLEPRMNLRIGRRDGIAKDADGCAAVDFLESGEYRPKKSFISRGVAHVVDGKDDDGFDAAFADPLRRGQFGVRESGMKRIGFVQKYVSVAGASSGERWD